MLKRDFLLGCGGLVCYSGSFATGSGTVEYDVTDKRFFGGAKGDGKTSDYLAFQAAMIYAANNGGGRVVIPSPKIEWVLDAPVFVMDNTHVVGSGRDCRIRYKNPIFKNGRGGFVIGSSVEANRVKAFQFFEKGVQPENTRNDAFKNPDLKQYLQWNREFIQAKNSTISGIYLIADFDSKGSSGGYGINLVNAWDCHAFNIWGEGWTQLIGMGSDGVPETPSNYMCSAYDLQVVKPDPVHTYYAIGFISNSTNCSIHHAQLQSPITDGTPNGSGIALNYAENCSVHDIDIPNLGRTRTSEGILLQNCKGCVVDNVVVGNAKTAVATFFRDASFNDASRPNRIGPNVEGVNCDRVIRVGGKFAIVLGYRNSGSKYDVTIGNVDAMRNTIIGPNRSVETPLDGRRQVYLEGNSFK